MEPDRRTTQQTADLAQANEELKKEIAELRQALEELRRKQFELRRTTDAIPCLITVLNPDGVVLSANQALLEYTGLTLEDVQKEDYRSRVFHPEDLERQCEQRREALTHAVPFELEHRALGRDGKYRWFFVRYKPLLDEQGKIVRWYVVGSDIDERKQAEEKFRRSEAYLAEAQRLSHTGSFGWKPDTGEIVWSNETYRIFEYIRAEKPTLEKVFERIHPEDEPLARQIVDGVHTNGKDFEHECRLLLPGGTVKHIHVRAHALRDSSGKIEFVGAVTDITERKLAEENLRRSEERFRLVLDSIGAYVIATTLEGELEFANQPSLDYFGKTLEELKRWQTSGDVLHPDDLASAPALGITAQRTTGPSRWTRPIHREPLGSAKEPLLQNGAYCAERAGQFPQTS